MPGLINGHNHAAMTIFRGYSDDLELQDWLQKAIWPIEDKLTKEDLHKAYKQIKKNRGIKNLYFSCLAEKGGFENCFSNNRSSGAR